jgi:hypothetical protein
MKIFLLILLKSLVVGAMYMIATMPGGKIVIMMRNPI